MPFSMKSLSLLLIFFAATSCTTVNESSRAKLNSRVERIENSLVPRIQIKGQEVPRYNIIERMAELGIPGLSVAFVSNGKIEWAKAYGWADVSEKRRMTTESMLLAGSVSKPVAAIRALQLVEDEQIDLDKNVNTYLSSWKLPENEFTEKEKVTLRRILNHTAGLTTWGFPGYDKGDKIPSIPEVLDGKGNTDAVRVFKKPGESWQYSGGGYTIMQLMITDVEGKPFPEIMQENVLTPLGMKKSTFSNPLPETFHSIAATGYRRDGSEVEGKWPIYPEMAAAGLWTTPCQLGKYAIEIQRINSTKHNGILEFETVDEMLTPGMNGHGLGPVVNEVAFGHDGADEGFRAKVAAWRDLPQAVVIMVNSDNGKIMEELLLSIAQEYQLPGITADTREVIPRSAEFLQKYTGSYQFRELGVVKIELKNGTLVHKPDFVDEIGVLLSESESQFFDRDSGTRFDFNLVEGKVVGFTAFGTVAPRIEQLEKTEAP